MWICLNDSFLSIVATPEDPDTLLVRARFQGDIEAVFPGADVIHVPKRDYAFRAYLHRETVTTAIANRVHNIDYGNFKDSVPSRERHDVYLDLWSVMRRAQTMFRGRKPGAGPQPKSRPTSSPFFM